MDNDTRARLDTISDIAGPALLITALQGGSFLEIEEIPADEASNRKWRVRLIVDPPAAG